MLYFHTYSFYFKFYYFSPFSYGESQIPGHMAYYAVFNLKQNDEIYYYNKSTRTAKIYTNTQKLGREKKMDIEKTRDRTKEWQPFFHFSY